MFENAREIQKLQENIFSANVLIGAKKCFESFCVYVYRCMYSFFSFSYVLSFSLHISVLFDPLLWLTSLGATSISALPHLQAS